jgi:hypothetical protein
MDSNFPRGNSKRRNRTIELKPESTLMLSFYKCSFNNSIIDSNIKNHALNSDKSTSRITNLKNKKEAILRKDLFIKKLIEKRQSNYNMSEKKTINNVSAFKHTNVFFKLNESHDRRTHSLDPEGSSQFGMFNFYKNFMRFNDNSYKENEKLFKKENDKFRITLTKSENKQKTQSCIIPEKNKFEDNFFTYNRSKLIQADENYKNWLNNTKSSALYNKLDQSSKKINKRFKISHIELNPYNVKNAKKKEEAQNFYCNKNIRDIIIKTIDDLKKDKDLLNFELLNFKSTTSDDKDTFNKSFEGNKLPNHDLLLVDKMSKMSKNNTNNNTANREFRHPIKPQQIIFPKLTEKNNPFNKKLINNEKNTKFKKIVFTKLGSNNVI